MPDSPAVPDPAALTDPRAGSPPQRPHLTPDAPAAVPVDTRAAGPLDPLDPLEVPASTDVADATDSTGAADPELTAQRCRTLLADLTPDTGDETTQQALDRAFEALDAALTAWSRCTGRGTS